MVSLDLQIEEAIAAVRILMNFWEKYKWRKCYTHESEQPSRGTDRNRDEELTVTKHIWNHRRTNRLQHMNRLGTVSGKSNGG